jgi:hypothetical protein
MAEDVHLVATTRVTGAPVESMAAAAMAEDVHLVATTSVTGAPMAEMFVVVSASPAALPAPVVPTAVSVLAVFPASIVPLCLFDWQHLEADRRGDDDVDDRRFRQTGERQRRPSGQRQAENEFTKHVSILSFRDAVSRQ